MSFFQKNWHWLALSVAVIVAIVLTGRKKGWFVTSATGSGQSDPNTAGPGSSGSSTNSIDENLLLKKGMKNSSVSELQRLINIDLKTGTGGGRVSALTVDGDFGKATETALNQMKGQKAISLKVYRATKSWLGTPYPKPNPADFQISAASTIYDGSGIGWQFPK